MLGVPRVKYICLRYFISSQKKDLKVLDYFCKSSISSCRDISGVLPIFL